MKEYHFNQDGVCVDYDKPVVRHGKHWSLEIRIARTNQGWVYGYFVQASQPWLYDELHVSSHDNKDVFKTKREAIRAALVKAKTFFEDVGEENAVKRCNALILDYSTPSLFPDEDE